LEKWNVRQAQPAVGAAQDADPTWAELCHRLAVGHDHDAVVDLEVNLVPGRQGDDLATLGQNQHRAALKDWKFEVNHGGILALEPLVVNKKEWE
jgi:hypothetical protein